MESMHESDRGWNLQSIQQGWDVFDANNDKVGDVSDISGTYLIVSKGFIFTSERYIPNAAISQVANGQVYLNVTKNEIESRGWDQPPTATTESATEEGTLGGPAPTASERPATEDNTDTLRYSEERLRADKERYQAGEVTVGKDVVIEEQSMDVPVTHEEVTIERRQVDPTRSTEGEIGASDQEISVPIHEERVNVEKEPVVYEEVDVKRREVHGTERVSDTVRREEPRIETKGDVEEEIDLSAHRDEDLPGEPDRPSH